MENDAAFMGIQLVMLRQLFVISRHANVTALRHRFIAMQSDQLSKHRE